ncbi:hypothetical protein CF326_g8934 [Tilletia indica]|nr:hypothetical protein CF326_g8934 [Tilletia indica]
MRSPFDSKPMTTLWVLWAQIPDTVGTKTTIENLIKLASKDCNLRFPKSSTLHEPNTVLRSATDWAWIFTEFGHGLTFETYDAGTGPDYIRIKTDFEVRSEHFSTFFSFLFVPPSEDWITTALTLRVFRAGAILPPNTYDLRFILQGTILMLEWGSLYRHGGAFTLWDENNPFPYLDTVSTISARVLVRGNLIEQGIHTRFRILIALETSAFLME